MTDVEEIGRGFFFRNVSGFFLEMFQGNISSPDARTFKDSVCGVSDHRHKGK